MNPFTSPKSGHGPSENSPDSGFWRRVWALYRDGFREMTVGRTLWTIIILKLIILFAVIKVLFFPDLLQRDFDNDADRAAHVRRTLAAP